jgi:hypothetical protein
MNVVPLETLTLARFSELVNTQFRTFISPTAELSLELAQALPGPSSGRAGRQYESFSLIFHGPEEPLLPQGTRPFEHERLGRFDLFIVPIAREAGVIKYEAVFNRLIRPA